MARWMPLLAIAAAGVGIGCAIRMLSPDASAAGPAPEGPPVPAATGATPILVELFTSEGCSSCPSADAALARIEHDQTVAGARVIVLAHHVDYWDRLGWPDPWSSKDATARQRTYAPLKSGSYTPQAVIDGRIEMVGSRGAAVEQAVATTAKLPHAKLELAVLPVPNETNAFDVTVKTSALPAGSADADLLVAVVQDRGRVAVPRGENAGQTLDHTAIVRSLGPTTRIRLPAVIDAPNGTTFSVVAFLQERSSRKVLGSNALPLTH